MAGLDNGINFLFDETDAPEAEGRIQYALPYNPLKDKALYDAALQGGLGASSFLIRWKSSCGGSFRQGLFLKIYMKTPMALVFCMTIGIPTFWGQFGG